MADDKKPIPLADLYAEYNAMRGELLDLADKLDPEVKTSILENDKRIQDLIAEREAKVNECHPNGNHWPPHKDCPACQKVAQKWDKIARDRCKELGLPETEENLERVLKEYLDTVEEVESQAPKL